MNHVAIGLIAIILLSTACQPPKIFNSDDDSSYYVNDVCFDLTDAIYDICSSDVVTSDGSRVSGKDIYNFCLAEGGSAPWPCAATCSLSGEANCDDRMACLEKNCGIQTIRIYTCEEIVRVTYENCEYEYHDVDGDGISKSDAEESCRKNAEAWECSVECFAKAEDCESFRNCVEGDCGGNLS